MGKKDAVLEAFLTTPQNEPGSSGLLVCILQTQCGQTAHRPKLAGKAVQLSLSGIEPKLISLSGPVLAW